MEFSTLLFWCFLNCSVLSYTTHDLHVSRCEIVYDTESHALQVTLNIFIDDLETALLSEGKGNLFLCTKKEDPRADQFIAEYLGKTLKINVDEETTDMVFLGKEAGDDIFALWCYLEIPDIEPKEVIEVSYDLLMEIYDDQRNIVKLSYSKTTQAHFLFDHKKFTGNLIIK